VSGENKIAAVVLAAGASRRLGRPKQEIVLGGETLVQRAVRVAMEAGLSPVIVVVNPECRFAGPLRERGCMMVVNDQAAEGMASSIRSGAGVAQQVASAGAVVMTCDQVALRAEHLRALCAEPGSVAGSGYGGKVGIPAYFPAASFAGLMELRGDVGARELLRGAHVVLDEWLALDVDSEEDLAKAQVLLDHGARMMEAAKNLQN
jgi:CTP:molybdopterin cytidylyltransferase MocA